MVKRTFLNSNQSEAVDRIVAEAVQNMEDAEDKLAVEEVARNKLLLLFKEGSIQFAEASMRLFDATDEQLIPDFQSKMHTLTSELYGGDPLTRFEESMPKMIDRAKTVEELDSLLAKQRDYIESFSKDSIVKLTWLKRIILLRKLNQMYSKKRRALSRGE